MKIMTTKLTLSALAAVLGLTVAGTAVAKSPWEMNLGELRVANLPKASVEACPMDDDKFWSHWATERGYEHMLSGNMDKAAACYDKAAEMYRRGVASERQNDCGVCDTYHRFATLLRELPPGAINLAKETFEESAKRALERGDKPLASTLYELTAIGFSQREIEGYYGRFGGGNGNRPIHRESASWQDGHLKAGEFFETAAGLAPNEKERKRLLLDARDFAAGILDAGYCHLSEYSVRSGENHYGKCKQAEGIVTRLDKVLK